MKIAAHILAYNVDKFIEPVLKNLENNVDKVYIAYSEYPWNYNPINKLLYKNETNLEYLNSLINKFDCDIEIITGNWDYEEEQRNECLNKAREENFDWLIIQDADEFYTQEGWIEIRKVLENDKFYDHFKTTWFNFWKSSKFVIQYEDGSIKGSNAGFAVRCSSNLYFIRARNCSYTEKSKTIDIPCYHYGYVLSDNEMLMKINLWAHTNEFFTNRQEWYELKYKNWNLKSKYLNTKNPISFNKAIVFNEVQPEFAEQFNYHVDLDKKANLFQDTYYNVKVFCFSNIRNFKRLFIPAKFPIKMT
jgi:hypothetical protein